MITNVLGILSEKGRLLTGHLSNFTSVGFIEYQRCLRLSP